MIYIDIAVGIIKLILIIVIAYFAYTGLKPYYAKVKAKI